MRGLLNELRRLMPFRATTAFEAFAVAEAQADALLARAKLTEPAVPLNLIYRIPLLDVEVVSPLGASGVVAWNSGRWQMLLNGDEPQVRQRFSSFHELKHVIDSPVARIAYPPTFGYTSHERREAMADHFAASVLMPKKWVRKFFAKGRHTITELAQLFNVSRTAMRFRLINLGLVSPESRCGGFE